MSTERAKELRKNSTIAERRMWLLLGVFRTSGYHFRKQVPIGPYFADMACHHAKIIIEVDGDTHGTDAGIAHDARRDAFLERQGYTLLRFGNAEVLKNPDGVFQMISGALEGRPESRRSTQKNNTTISDGTLRP